MGLSCEVEFPTNCTRASEPLEVLTDIMFLMAFAVGQASSVGSPHMHAFVPAVRCVLLSTFIGAVGHVDADSHA